MPDVRQPRDKRTSGRDPLVPDYPLADHLDITTRSQMRAIADPTRQAITTLVLERAASTTELALALGRPKGTIDHHLKVLANAGLIQVVRTRKVRAMTERFWGRTARTYNFGAAAGDVPTPMWMVREAHEEMEAVLPGLADDGSCDVFSTLRHARIPAARAREFGARLYALADEFVVAERGGDVMYGMLLALYPTAQATLPEATS